MLIERKFQNRATYSKDNYVCPNCLYTLNNCKCKVFPPYYLIMIDTGMQKIIRILNGKGYKTIGCCESHYGTMTPYISIVFNTVYKYDIPEGFKVVKNGKGILHEFDEDISMEDWKIEKDKYMEILFKWAESLPENKTTY